MTITRGAQATLLTGSTDWGASGLSNNAYSNAGTAYDNSANLYEWGEFEFAGTFGTAPTANTTIDLYLVPSADGANYADGGGAVAPDIGDYACSFQVRAVTTAQRRVRKNVILPLYSFRAVALNNATGQVVPNTSTVKVTPYKY